MTYCVALKLDQGLVCLSDTRTNAGIDDVSRYRKTFTWEVPGERAIVLMTAGNLSVTQGVVTRLEAAVKEAEGSGEQRETILTVPTLFRLAQIVGQLMRQILDKHRDRMEKDGASSGASILVGGQIKGEPLRLFLVYSAGNFIECGEDAPFFQIGEAKYGKPILDRTIRHDTPITHGLRAALVSMDSTIRSNLSVGAPLDLCVVEADSQRIAVRRRIDDEDPTYRAISSQWSAALHAALHDLPDLSPLLS